MTEGRRRSMPRILLVSVLAATLIADAAFGFVCEQSGSGECVHWTDHAASLQSFLGSPGPVLSNGTTSWDQNAMSAANDWNTAGANFRFDIGVGGQFQDPCGSQGMNNVCANPPGNNPIYFAKSQCGIGFGDTIELTLLCWTDPTGALNNAAVLVNNNVAWNAYDGALRVVNGRVVYDIRRVLLHELGHALGLDHPDQHGQRVAAIMNSQVSDFDRLQPDDRSGIVSLYGGAPAPAGDGSSAPSTGCQIERLPGSPVAWLLALPLCIVALARRRRARSPITARETRPRQ
jgi:hypothetical protein